MFSSNSSGKEQPTFTLSAKKKSDGIPRFDSGQSSPKSCFAVFTETLARELSRFVDLPLAPT